MGTTSKTARKQSRSLRTREHILSSALSLFVLHGYPETSMEDICRESGTSKGGLYHHFPTKQAVLLATLARLHRLDIADGLWPPIEPLAAATGLPVAGFGRFLLDVWAEAARAEAVAQAADLPVSKTPHEHLALILRVGTLMQALLTDGPGARMSKELEAAERAA
jgi:AcrR family transcriptional regulator